MSDYGIAVVLDAGFEEAVARTRAALAEQGFGVLTEIDVAATMRAKLGAELPPYLILGACNPPLALRAVTTEPDIGLLLPCNVLVRALPDGRTSVAAMDPQAMVQVTGNDRLEAVADEAGERLTAALAQLAGTAVAR